MDDVISSSELPQLFACLSPYRRLVLGVSGGADSLCLMHLVAEWRSGLEGGLRPEVIVVTIDHGLRASSGDEALDVARRAGLLGLVHETRKWTGPRPASGLQAEARAMRYRLMGDVARGVGSGAVVVAHTEDDQAETLIMRLKRGSGVDGLSAMPVVRALGEGVDLVRPLLGVSRARIEATLRARGISWISDPSNESAAFERVRVRQARGMLDEIGFTAEMLALSAERLGRARRALEAATAAFLAAGVEAHEGVFASFPRAAFDALPDEIRIRVLDRLIRAYGGAAEPALLSQIEALDVALKAETASRFSLGGAVVSAGERNVRVYREAGRLSADPMPLAPGKRLVWDGRFAVFSKKSAGECGVLTVAPLGASEGGSADATLAAAGLRLPDRASEWPRRALLTLPAVFSGSRLIAVPHFHGAQETDSDFRVEFLGLGARG